MLAKRIIPCLDVKNGRVVKGVRFRDHVDVGDIVSLAVRYADEGADELVFYDITASPEGRAIEPDWIRAVARYIDIPFCVAGGIRSVDDARARLFAGADKISINSPALENPGLIDRLAAEFGQQCVVVGIDSRWLDGTGRVYSNTGDPDRMRRDERLTLDWVAEVARRGAGEVVLNCMDQDGVRSGYDLSQLTKVREFCPIPLIASGGAGSMQDFSDVFTEAAVDGALAASVFHNKTINIGELKSYLSSQNITVRL